MRLIYHVEIGESTPASPINAKTWKRDDESIVFQVRFDGEKEDDIHAYLPVLTARTHRK